jgi:polyphosphate kinase 2 (PPK2 family)
MTADYAKDIAALEDRLERLQAAHITHGQRSVIMFEGWDAAGKGGIIQRLTASLDPRYFEVWPIAAPNDEEKSRHFLWRFWKRLPGNREISIFDRSWYGRVLVERVEGYAAEAEGGRAMTRSTSSRRNSPAAARTWSSCSSTSPRRNRMSASPTG